MRITLIGMIFTRLKYFCHQILKSNRYNLTKRLTQYLESGDCDFPAEEKKMLKQFLSKTLVSQISYLFIKEYNYRIINVLWDKTKSLHYVFHNKKKLYFRKGLSKNGIRNMYNALCIEQDTRSPHSYSAFPVNYKPTDIAVDIGAAEGIWALDIAEKVNEIYLFECEDAWIEALQATFEPWKDRVHIVNKYISDFTNEQNTTLDDYFGGKNIFPTIIKADIEGAEVACVKGAKILLSQHIRQAFICTYHNFGDFVLLTDMMKNYQFAVQPSKGYMISIYSESGYNCKDIKKIFRKGLIYANK